MIEKIKNYLASKRQNKQNITLSYTTIFFGLLIFTSSLDAVSTYLVLVNGGYEINSHLATIIETSFFMFLFVKVIVYPTIFFALLVGLSDLLFYIFKNDKTADSFFVTSVCIFSLFYFLASIYNFVNYIILVI